MDREILMKDSVRLREAKQKRNSAINYTYEDSECVPTSSSLMRETVSQNFAGMNPPL
jgi:hypothetical protein